MKRSTDRILTTHPGRLPNPANQADVLAARAAGNQARFDELVKGNIPAIIARQKEVGVDIMSDGEFWKARDGKYYNSRVTGIETKTLGAGEWPSILGNMPERREGEFKTFYEVYDAVGNTPRPGTLNAPATEKHVMTGPVKGLPSDAMKHEIEVVKAGIAAAGESIDNFFFPVLGPGWLDHFVFDESGKSEEEYCYALAEIVKNDMHAVVEAGFLLQIDDPGLCDRWCMLNPPVTVEEYRRQEAIRIEATNWCLEGIPEENVRYHTCWGSWHTPHITDIPFEHVVDLMLRLRVGAYSVEAADVRHVLDYEVWEKTKLPDGKIFIPGVIAHKTTTVEPPEWVAHQLVRYANLMGRENVIAGVDCGVGNRSYPEIGWAKLRALSEGAALASKKLWGR